MIRLYSAAVCPFCQRTRALLVHLRVEFETIEIDLDARDPEFLKLSPTGKVPHLVDGKLELYESAVIAEYLAERHRMAAAFDADPATRARERLAIAAWDQTMASAFYRTMRARGEDGTRTHVTRELQELLRTVRATGKRLGNLLSFHVAPFWARMQWLRDLSPIAGWIDEWIELKGWLDEALAQPAIQRTLPDRDEAVRRYRAWFPPA